MAESNNNSPNQLKFAGDINIQNLTITSLVSGATFNVAGQVAGLHIFEDLFSPFTTGSISFLESLDFAANFPFVGEEVLDMKIYTPTFDKVSNNLGIIEGRFYIYKMSDRHEMADKNIMYQLHFIAIEAISDLNVKLSKGYDGKISDIVKKILKEEDNLSTTKNINVEETGNKTKYVSNFWSPIRNINFLLEKAQTTDGNPTYTFFQNRAGFNFVSLDLLNGSNITQSFSVNNSNDSVTPSGGSKRNFDIDYKRITEMNVDTTYDYMDRVRSGAYGSTLLYMDLTTKKYYNKKFSIFDKWDKGGRLNQFPIASNNLYATYRGAMFADNIELGLFTDWDDVSNIQIRQNRISRLKQAESYKIEILVPGRTDYTVGQVVSIKKFKSEPIKTKDATADILDNLISGNYLVSAIHHSINRQKHECRMELIKDSIMMNLDNAGKTQ
jgi:hypothetical protein